MLSTTDLTYQVGRILGMTPSLIVILVGFVMALQRLPRHRRAYGCLLAALSLELVGNLFLPLAMQTLISFINSQGINGPTGAGWMFFWTLPYSVVSAVTWALVLIAVFDRPDRPKFLVEDDPERDILDR